MVCHACGVVSQEHITCHVRNIVWWLPEVQKDGAELLLKRVLLKVTEVRGWKRGLVNHD